MLAPYFRIWKWCRARPKVKNGNNGSQTRATIKRIDDKFVFFLFVSFAVPFSSCFVIFGFRLAIRKCGGDVSESEMQSVEVKKDAEQKEWSIFVFGGFCLAPTVSLFCLFGVFTDSFFYASEVQRRQKWKYEKQSTQSHTHTYDSHKEICDQIEWMIICDNAQLYARKSHRLPCPLWQEKREHKRQANKTDLW